MARKSKKNFTGFGKLPTVCKQRLSKKERQELDALEQKMIDGPLASQYAKVVRNPKGQVKMSEVLEAFVQPYTKSVKNYQQRLMLMETASFAWNVSLLPEEKQSQFVEEMLEDVCAGQTVYAKQAMRETVEEMIVRKQTLFDEHQRSIVDFKIHETEEGYHIAVMSAPIEQADSAE